MVLFDRTLIDIESFMQEQGFYYSKEQIFDFYVSLKTKPFLILSGISGSGKSKIAELFAEYMGKAYGIEDNYELVAVKPNWTDSRGMFGYHNVLNDTYSITGVVKLFIRALQNPEKPYFLVLDEMNLAKVEHYFSDFLSVLESRRYAEGTFSDKVISNFGQTMTLSQAIILAALEKGNNQFESLDYFRDNPIVQWWQTNRSQTEDKKAQFRTELNQGRPTDKFLNSNLKLDGKRLAGRAFFAQREGNSYKLKEPSEMDAKTLEQFEEVRQMYDFIAKNSIKQQKITLHNSNLFLKTEPNQKEFRNDLGINLYDEDDGYYVPSEIQIPLNVFVVGTVNVDETTYMFSPKVLDRSNVIEFNDIDLYHAFGYGERTDNNSVNLGIENNDFNMEITLATSEDTKKFIEKYSENFHILVEINDVLKGKNRHFGYRVFNEISSFVLNYCPLDSNKNEVFIALDLQVLQKVLPKINGSEDEVGNLLNEIKEICDNNFMPRTSKKIKKMLNSLANNGYTTFIE
ncbi:AAA family ATPase [Enterococcus faecalis]|uniref:AAA family ATPase n=1 Tax=Enterococcus TaxID=1350 RepID=UPI0003546759|nr:AAA family ATPase [Enterococcus faecalis]EGO6633260.1 AAA domain-containing protein [Enterococcus faecalis]EGO8522307.1 hypothetical protein [Enterococcus faecalis]EGO9140685.1 hypothetical protein [Enterococcus faecalis]EHE8534157.1 AAA domain-containing protein [Enterococcus faecalis]EIT2385261.1 AAA family ATPase [Enterococcus faecalis]